MQYLFSFVPIKNYEQEPINYHVHMFFLLVLDFNRFILLKNEANCV